MSSKYPAQVRRSARKSAGIDSSDAAIRHHDQSDDEEASNPFAGASTSTADPFSATSNGSGALPLVSYTVPMTERAESSSISAKYAPRSSRSWNATTASTVALVSSAQEQFSQSWNITALVVLLEMVWIATSKIKFNSITFGPHPWLLLNSPTPAFDLVLPNFGAVANLSFLQSIFSYSLLTILLPAIASSLIAFPSTSTTAPPKSTPQKLRLQFDETSPLSRRIASPNVVVFAIFRLAILILCNFILRNPSDFDDGIFPGDGEWSFSEDMYGFEEVQVLGAGLNLALVVLAFG